MNLNYNDIVNGSESAIKKTFSLRILYSTYISENVYEDDVKLAKFIFSLPPKEVICITEYLKALACYRVKLFNDVDDMIENIQIKVNHLEVFE